MRNIDVSRKGFEGLHQLRIFVDITPDVEPKSGIFVLFANQQRAGKDKAPHHPAWYTGKIERDAVPIRFLDLDKVYYALEEAKRLQQAYEQEQEPPPQVAAAEPENSNRGSLAARIRSRLPVISVPKLEEP